MEKILRTPTSISLDRNNSLQTEKNLSNFQRGLIKQKTPSFERGVQCKR